MTPKEARFVAEYLKDLNATQAAIRAGYSAKTANRIASRLLSKVDIAERVSEKQASQLEAADLTATRTLEEMRRLAFSNVRNLFDDHGNLKPIHTLSEEDAACLAGLEVVKKNITAGDGQMDTVIKVRVWDKPRTLEMLGKHFSVLTEKVEHGGAITLKHEIPD